MRNRAKCRLCEEVIESTHQYHLSTCSCGEIGVDGGTTYFRSIARNPKNFIRLDEDGNELEPISDDQIEPMPPKATKSEMLDMLKQMIKTMEQMPPQAMNSYVTNYDLYSVLLLFSGLFKEDCA